MNIKKHPNGNEYLRCENLWVRNITNKTISSLQLNNLYDKKDYELLIKNEQFNSSYPKVSEEKLIFDKVLIVSDGFDFATKHKIISKMPKDICILAVNKSLKKWKLLDKNLSREDRRT